MNIEEFEAALRRFIRRQPFQPFEVVSLASGPLEVTDPTVAFAGGAATYLTPDYDLAEFACEDVRAFHPVNAAATRTDSTTAVVARSVRAFTRRQPFRPFLIELHSGDRLTVSHPEAVAWRGELFVYRSEERGQSVFLGSAVSQLLDPEPSSLPLLDEDRL
jgi:hypothetical protein